MLNKITQQQMDNLLAAQEAWKTIPPETVELSHYRSGSAMARHSSSKPDCGSAACFGGWLPFIDHFKMQRVHANFSGLPTNGVHSGGMLSLELFGWTMFGCRNGTVQPAVSGAARKKVGSKAKTGHREVIERLKFAIKNSEVTP